MPAMEAAIGSVQISLSEFLCVLSGIPLRTLRLKTFGFRSHLTASDLTAKFANEFRKERKVLNQDTKRQLAVEIRLYATYCEVLDFITSA
jgi:hypothetical protein